MDSCVSAVSNALWGDGNYSFRRLSVLIIKKTPMKKTRSAGVPAKTGGYDYSTGNSQNKLFNQGLEPRAEGVPSSTGGYDYSAKGRASRINGHHSLVGTGPASGGQPGSQEYGTIHNKKATNRKQSAARGRK